MMRPHRIPRHTIRPRAYRPLALLALTAALLLGAAGNVLAEGVHATGVELYAGLPGLGGRLVDGAAPRPTGPAPGARVLITTLSYASTLRRSWAAAERAAPALDPATEGLEPHGAVILSETHSEGRVHTVRVHPDDANVRIPAPHAPTHAVDARGVGARPGGGPIAPTAGDASRAGVRVAGRRYARRRWW